MKFTSKNSQNPRLIAFCGLPGSGKSTLARKVEQETGALRLNADEWVADLGVDFFDDDFRHKLQTRLTTLGLDLLKRGQSIIIEDVLWRRDERDRHREIAHDLGATIEIHYFDVSFDELWRRLESRNASRAHGSVPISKELLKKCWEMFERQEANELILFDQYTLYSD